MKLFGRKGDTLYVAVLIILILLISCVGFGYCLSFSYREGNKLRGGQIPVTRRRGEDRHKLFLNNYDLEAIDRENDIFVKQFSLPPEKIVGIQASNLNENNY